VCAGQVQHFCAGRYWVVQHCSNLPSDAGMCDNRLCITQHGASTQLTNADTSLTPPSFIVTPPHSHSSLTPSLTHLVVLDLIHHKHAGPKERKGAIL
jgi:hypothetical protein